MVSIAHAGTGGFAWLCFSYFNANLPPVHPRIITAQIGIGYFIVHGTGNAKRQKRSITRPVYDFDVVTIPVKGGVGIKS